jgi:hypothetical protein
MMAFVVVLRFFELSFIEHPFDCVRPEPTLHDMHNAQHNFTRGFGGHVACVTGGGGGGGARAGARTRFKAELR